MTIMQYCMIQDYSAPLKKEASLSGEEYDYRGRANQCVHSSMVQSWLESGKSYSNLIYPAIPATDSSMFVSLPLIKKIICSAPYAECL